MNTAETLDQVVAEVYAVPALEYALAAILDCHTRILAAHPVEPRAVWRRRKYKSALDRYAAVRMGERSARR